MGFLREHGQCATGAQKPVPFYGTRSVTTKQQGNIALSRAIAYLSTTGHYIFLPVGDSGGTIDIVVSPDGVILYRVQCKYTEHLHSEMSQRYPGRMVYMVGLRQVKERIHRIASKQPCYEKISFDWLFVSTPKGDYLIDWPKLCEERGKVPSALILGKQLDQYIVKQPIVSTLRGQEQPSRL